MTIHRIALTAGEPAGIGPDLCIQLAQQEHDCEIVVFGDPDLISQRAAQINLPITLKDFGSTAPATPRRPGNLSVFPIALAEPCQAGRLNPSNSRYVLQTIEQATRECLQGRFDAIVTAPVHKAVINEAGIPFSGHTEFIAAITGGHPVMMLATPGLRVALATTHLPLAAVSKAIDADLLTQVITIMDTDLRRRFAIASPRILICGLNPHAGENGHLGREEIEIIEPVISQLRSQGLNLSGPLPADTIFTPKYLQQADAILAMYHDQGLPVLKHIGFGQAVNITLGLPIIRTSVDHGTALELAATGKAEAGSLHYAIATALTMATGKRH
ncbi:4-hydroxythreonine-4-phosphate dehydrogenase PdxA [Methylomarinum vadi]|uniref:4-hydroxythreonine-4-phosphate dehydrogenase PdxA n=1 Tax=Methylomarinum vadi TaxID=438855 RepID=UPI0004DED42B|nr:4-hydroxythreonine-4-phosphate dehydrogenase PdxA [Methylomarinum vadi]